jgi:1-deoxy-D-xylulose-5-phosphate reductoisomerase
VRGVAILGVTGSIGRSALTVLEQHRDRFRVVAVTAHRSEEALERIVREVRPALAVLSDGGAPRVERREGGTLWSSGGEGLLEAATHPGVDVVINALVGAAGLAPTLAALGAGKRVALANKESLVCGGALVLRAAHEGGGELVPVDSEHSAILQCLQGAPVESIRMLTLTASGGPFRGLSRERLDHVSPQDALRHPTWDMGAKVTIDSATLANKALEVIEAHHLFGVEYDRIDAVVHPQSIVHSLVEFVDGSVLAQVGFPTMELPVLYALTHPRRLPYHRPRFDPVAAGPLTFEPLRREDFPAFALGVGAGRAGGLHPAVFNAANEVAVAAFLEERLSFPGIGAAIEHALAAAPSGEPESLDAVLDVDGWARRATATFIESHPC